MRMVGKMKVNAKKTKKGATIYLSQEEMKLLLEALDILDSDLSEKGDRIELLSSKIRGKVDWSDYESKRKED